MTASTLFTTTVTINDTEYRACKSGNFFYLDGAFSIRPGEVVEHRGARYLVMHCRVAGSSTPHPLDPVTRLEVDTRLQ